MATLSSVKNENFRSLSLFIFTLTTVSSDDTYDTGLGTRIVGFWATGQTNVTAGEEGINVSNSAGTVTFALNGDAQTVTLYVLAHGA
jgi:hypothetical protein